MKKAILVTILLIFWVPLGHGEMYKWMDEKGTIHFTDDLSNIPEKYRPDAEIRKSSKESSPTETREKPTSLLPLKASETEGMEISLFRRGELWLTEVILNERVKRNLIVDTGASFTLINQETRKELGLTIDENTPFIPGSTVSGVILTPLVTLKSLRVGKAEMENVEVAIHDMPSGQSGLLGNSFLNKFRVVLDSNHGKMTLFPLQGISSIDRPGGYSREFWISQFRFYHNNLAELKKLKAKYESRGTTLDLNRVNNAIRYFENQLSELERKASFAGVPRNWRE